MSASAEIVRSEIPMELVFPLTPGEPAPLVIRGLPLPVRLHLERPLSDEELLRFCAINDDLRVEQEPDGELLVLSPTGSETGDQGSELNAQLRNWAKINRAGRVFDSSAGFKLPDGSTRSPDSCLIDRSRWMVLLPEQRRRFAPICPDFVAELVSPGDRLPVVREKMDQWIRNGTQLGWLIDPERRVVEVYRSGAAEPEVIEGALSVTGEGPVAGFVLELHAIWDVDA